MPVGAAIHSSNHKRVDAISMTGQFSIRIKSTAIPSIRRCRYLHWNNVTMGIKISAIFSNIDLPRPYHQEDIF
jgi:hypothetical protein